MRLTGTLLAVLILLAGCASGGSAIDPCGPWQPVLVSKADVLTDGTARQILAHNETGARLCGW